MTKLQLSATDYDWLHHSSNRRHCAHGESVYHNLDVWNEIIINGQRFEAFYQTGQSFCCNSYSAPSNSLEFSEEASNERLCLLLNRLEDADFDDEELIAEKLKEAKEYCPHIDTVEKLFEVYQFFNENRPGSVFNFIGNVGHTDDINDYTQEESTGYLVLKKRQEND